MEALFKSHARLAQRKIFTANRTCWCLLCASYLERGTRDREPQNEASITRSTIPRLFGLMNNGARSERMRIDFFHRGIGRGSTFESSSGDPSGADVLCWQR